MRKELKQLIRVLNNFEKNNIKTTAQHLNNFSSLTLQNDITKEELRSINVTSLVLSNVELSFDKEKFSKAMSALAFTSLKIKSCDFQESFDFPKLFVQDIEIDDVGTSGAGVPIQLSFGNQRIRNLRISTRKPASTSTPLKVSFVIADLIADKAEIFLNNLNSFSTNSLTAFELKISGGVNANDKVATLELLSFENLKQHNKTEAVEISIEKVVKIKEFEVKKSQLNLNLKKLKPIKLNLSDSKVSFDGEDTVSFVDLDINNCPDVLWPSFGTTESGAKVNIKNSRLTTRLNNQSTSSIEEPTPFYGNKTRISSFWSSSSQVDYLFLEDIVNFESYNCDLESVYLKSSNHPNAKTGSLDYLSLIIKNDYSKKINHFELLDHSNIKKIEIKRCDFIKFICNNVKFLGTTIFEEVTFENAPHFFDSNLHSNTVFDNCRYQNLGKNSVNAFRELKEHMDFLKDEKNERLFASYEMESRFRSQRLFSRDFFVVIVSFFAMIFNMFGRSLTLPFIVILSIFILFFGFYFLVGECCGPSFTISMATLDLCESRVLERGWFCYLINSSNLNSAFFYSLLNSLGPLKYLLGSANLLMPTSLFIQIFGVLQTVLSTLLWYLGIAGFKKYLRQN